MKLTKEQIIKGIVHPFVVLLAFALKHLLDDNAEDKVQEILDETAASLSLVKEKFASGVTEDEAVEAGFEIAETITEATPTKVDEAVLSGIKGLYDVAKGKGGGLIAAVKAWIQISKAVKAEKK